MAKRNTKSKNTTIATQNSNTPWYKKFGPLLVRL